MRKILPLLLIFSASSLTYAQQKPKPPLNHQVYDGWQSVTSERISNDGKWVLYSVTPQEGDDKLIITNVQSNSVRQVARVKTAVFTEDSKYSVFMIKPFFKETRAAKIKKKKADELPKDSLGIITLGKPGIIKIARVKSFKLPERGSGVLAFMMEKAPADTAKKKAGGSKDIADDFLADDETAAAGAKSAGADLVLQELATAKRKTFKYVSDYAFSPGGKFLTFVSEGYKKDSLNLPGMYWYDIDKDVLKRISTGKGKYENLTFDDSDKQFAFTAEKGPEKSLQKFYSLYYYTPVADSAQVIIDKASRGMPANWSINNDGRIFFSKNAEKLFFGTAPVLAPKDTTIIDFEVAKVDVWSYKDEYLQPMQLKNMDRELKRSYMAVTYPKSGSHEMIQLGTTELRDIELGDQGDSEWALLSTDAGSRAEIQWMGSSSKDLYLVSTITGIQKKIAASVRGQANFSPKANYITWYDRKDQNWYVYELKSNNTRPFTKGPDVKWYDEEHDLPDDPAPYGIAAWTLNDEKVLVNDRYDIWAFNPSGGPAENITNGLGRKNQITFRYLDFRVEPAFRRFGTQEKSIDPKSPLWLQAFNNITKQNGWYVKDISNNKHPQMLVMAPRKYSKPAISLNGRTFIYTKASYKLSPDLYISNNFKKEKKLSDINPQQMNYNWGSAELISWTTPKGYKSDGILYKPENFDPNRKYPMIVYFYEKLSDGLYNYIPPTPTPSRLNISYFVSNGYLVFAPDISYEKGYPGRSAEEFINSGVEALKANSWVDGSRIGIQGQSWGGYQVAHLITRTNMYSAAWAGAPVVNMTSAYGGIRWESGMSRQFQYEKSQSRIGATLWEKPELYIENSPLFHLPKVNTPVVIMSNDADGAVPWYQGIEMFTALRRLNKPVWLLNYNNEAHNLVLRQNKKDIQIREQQFFDHYLKGAPAPAWMEKGVPATTKGKNWGFEISAPAPAEAHQ